MTKEEKNRRIIIGFFKAKGLLVAPDVAPQANIKLNIKDVIEFAAKHEPRVLEVFPAALIHFPKTFLGWEDLPEKLKQIVDRIKQGEREGPDFRGIRYKDMLRWARKRLNDKRTVPLSERKVMKSFRFRPETLSRLKELAKKFDLTETQVIERILVQGGERDVL